MTQEFRIQDLQDVQQLEVFFNNYAQTIVGKPYCGHLPKEYLSALFTHCRLTPNNLRLLYAVLDLEFTFLFMLADTQLAGGTWNQRFAPEHTNQESVLQDFGNFRGKMEILRGFTSFAYRCRAFWDKYMGILVLLQDDSQYDRFTDARSRKRTFRKIASAWEGFPNHVHRAVAECLLDRGLRKVLAKGQQEILAVQGLPYPNPTLDIFLGFIESLDTIRTAEAHGPGILRKFALAMSPLEESRDFELIGDWNIANKLMHALRDTILES